MKTVSLLAGMLLTTVNAAATETIKSRLSDRAKVAKEEPSSPAQLNVLTVQGCFEDPGKLVFNKTLTFNSKSKCAQDTCLFGGFSVAATSGGNECYCGDKYPSSDSRVDDLNCNVGCTGYDIEACGGIGYWTIYNTGLTLNVASEAESPKSKAGNKTDSATPTAPASTVVVTEPSNSDKGGSNVGAIAGGVVVAVVIIASSITGFFFYMRRKRNREIEEEHRRNAAVNSFISGKAPSSSGMSISDSRLDPVMAQRRLSDGSIADNQDYSRKILRVTNA